MRSDAYPRDYRVYKIISYVAGGLVLAVILGLVLGFLVKFLWNATVAEIFDVPTITFWQAFALFVLAKLLFGFGGGSGSGSTPSKKRRKRRDEPVEGQEERPSMDDESFRKFWTEEGRRAYTAFLESRRTPPETDTDPGP